MPEDLSLEAFVEHTKKEYLGKKVAESFVAEPYYLDWRRVRDFAWGISDDNPLFCDPAYGAKTRWDSQIAPPIILSSIKYPMSHGALFDKSYKLSTFYAAHEMEWFDIVRTGDRIRSYLVLKDVTTKKGSTGDLVFLYTEGSFWNQHDDLIANQWGTLITVALAKNTDFGEKLIYQQREAYRYNDEEIKRIVDDYHAEACRGAKPLYWSDVEVGDKLQPIVRGPLSMGDLIQWRINTVPVKSHCPGPFRLQLKSLDNKPDFARTNPVTNWPYDHMEWEHQDTNLSRFRGLPLPFDSGVMRTQITSVLITNWMSDHGFLKRFKTRIQRPFYYGDTCWYRGEVEKKYQTVEGGKQYYAVDVKIEGKNQMDELITSGNATVYLPMPGHEFDIPIPCNKGE